MPVTRPISDEVSATVAAVRRETERSSARVRLAAMLALGLLLGVLIATSNRFIPFLAGAYALNLGLSVAAVRLADTAFRPWMPWALTSLDAVLLLGLLALGPFGQLLPAAFTPALSASWALFLLIALAALRADGPALVLYATAVLACGLALLMVFDPVPPGPPDAVAEALRSPVGGAFNPEPNTLRVTLLVLTGLVLALGAHRARRTLHRAVALARERQNLARHFSAPLADEIANRDHADLRRGRQQAVGIVFADIRGFTAMSEALDAADVVELLDAFRSRARTAIEGHGGVVDKFIGDAVMGVFGVPTPDGREAANTVAAARALSATMEAWSAKRQRAGIAPVSVGVGAHHGLAFVGAVGDEERAEFTVIGDAVNVAQRIEEATKGTQASLLVSHDLLAAAGIEGEIGLWIEFPHGPIRGRLGTVRLFRAADEAP